MYWSPEIQVDAILFFENTSVAEFSVPFMDTRWRSTDPGPVGNLDLADLTCARYSQNPPISQGKFRASFFRSIQSVRKGKKIRLRIHVEDDSIKGRTSCENKKRTRP